MKKPITYQKGFSLVEILIVSGIASMMTLATVNFFGGFEKLKKIFVEKADTVLSEKVAYAFLLKDLSYSSVSLNFLKVNATAETGNCPSSNFWTLSKDLQHSQCGVEFVLSDPRQEFYIIYQREAFILNINPEVFYKVNGSALNISFKNIKDYLDTNGVKRQNSVYKLESPTFIEDVNTGLHYNYGMMTFAGGTQGLNRLRFNNRKLDAMIPFSKNQNCRKTSEDLDGFMRCLPRQGDSATVNLMPVEVVRYKLKKQEGSNLFDLYRSRMRVNSRGEISFFELRVGEKIKQVTLKRQSITKPNVSFNIELM